MSFLTSKLRIRKRAHLQAKVTGSWSGPQHSNMAFFPNIPQEVWPYNTQMSQRGGLAKGYIFCWYDDFRLSSPQIFIMVNVLESVLGAGERDQFLYSVFWSGETT